MKAVQIGVLGWFCSGFSLKAIRKGCPCLVLFQFPCLVVLCEWFGVGFPFEVGDFPCLFICFPALYSLMFLKPSKRGVGAVVGFVFGLHFHTISEGPRLLASPLPRTCFPSPSPGRPNPPTPSTPPPQPPTPPPTAPQTAPPNRPSDSAPLDRRSRSART